MSRFFTTPVLWILIPGIASIILYGLRRWERSIHIAGVLIALLLAWLAWVLPIEETFSLGPWPALNAIKFSAVLNVLGRSFILDSNARPTLIIIYLASAFWFGGAYAVRTSRLFIPMGLAITALLTAALAVQPPLYAALLIEMVVLISIPILAQPGKTPPSGVLRFLTFQTIGAAMILFANWLLPSVEINPLDLNPALRSIALMGIGFALLSAVFPFHTWVPMLAEQAHPYAAAFVFFILPTAIAFLGVSYLNLYSRLGIAPLVYSTLQYAGILMIVTGGLWAAVQRNLGRIFGFAILVQIGSGLLALSLWGQVQTNTPVGAIFFLQILPRGIGLALWSQALYTLKDRLGNLQFSAVKGQAHHLPLTAASLLLSNFSLAGLPLLASFPVNVALWAALAGQSLPIALLSLVGYFGLLVAGLRSMAVLLIQSDQPGLQIRESRLQTAFYLAGWMLLFAAGIAPQWFFPALTNMALTFIQP